MKRLTIFTTSLILAIAASGCAVTTAGVKPGDERNMARSINDINADRVINARLKRTAGFDLGAVEVEVAEGIVVLSGNVPEEKDRIEAERIAWSAPNIVKVGNELKIKGNQSFASNTKDGILSQSVKTRLIADKYVKGRNINVEAYEGTVYLLGVARDTEEMKRAAEIASRTKGTKEVISYMRVANGPIPVQAPVQQAMPMQSAPQPYNPQQLMPRPSAPVQSAPLAAVPAPQLLPNQRALPEFLTSEPVPLSGQSIPTPIQPYPGAAGPTAPAEIPDMGDRLGKEFPTTDQLGAYRTGQSGEAVSIIESEPYYLDPETGEHIPVKSITGPGPK